MIKKISLVSFVVIVLIYSGSLYSDKEKKDLDKEIELADSLYEKKYYRKALESYKKIILKQKSPSLDLALIDKVGTIYLSKLHLPDEAIKYFDHLARVEKKTINDDYDDLYEWIAAAKKLKEIGKLPKEYDNPGKLFKTAKKLYEEGKRYKSSRSDKKGNSILGIVQKYFLYFIVRFNSDQRIGEVLYMLGDIQSYISNGDSLWAGNHYFKEVIRRFPHTKLAEKAWESLNETTHFMYSGSSGDHTPKTILEELKLYKDLAKVK